MFTQVTDTIGAMFTKIHEVGSSALKAGSSAIQSVASAITTKAHECSAKIWEKINAQAPVFEAAKRAVNNASEHISGVVGRTAAKIYVKTCASDSKVEGLRDKLRMATGSEQLANAVHRIVPHVLEKVKTSLGEDNKYANIIEDESVSCGKILEAKLLESLIQLAEKTENRNGENGGEHLVMSLIGQLAEVTARQLENPEQDPAILQQDLGSVAKWLMGKAANYSEAAIARAFLSQEYAQHPELLKEVREVAHELLAGFGINLSDKNSSSLEKILLGVVNTVVKEGISKVLFNMNEQLFSLNDKLNNADAADMPIASTIRDFCQNAAKTTTDTIFEALFNMREEEPGAESTPKPVEGQKGFIERILDKLFSFAFKWIFKSLGIFDDDGAFKPGFSWAKFITKPFSLLSQYFKALNKAGEETDPKKKAKKLDRVFENAMEDLIGEGLADWLLHKSAVFKKAEQKKEDDLKAEKAQAKKAQESQPEVSAAAQASVNN